MAKKTVREGVTGSPLHFDLEVGGKVITYELLCPMCGENHFVISSDHTIGGCINEGCPCICFSRLRDTADMGGVGWLI